MLKCRREPGQPASRLRKYVRRPGCLGTYLTCFCRSRKVTSSVLPWTRQQGARLPALLGHRDLAMANEGLLGEETEQYDHPREDLLGDLKGTVVCGDRGDHVLNVGDHSSARQANPIPLGVVLAGHPEQAENEITPLPPGVPEVVPLGGALPRSVACPPVAGPLPVTRVRDAEEAAGLVRLVIRAAPIEAGEGCEGFATADEDAACRLGGPACGVSLGANQRCMAR